ncbi:MAG: hypothetical protein GX846_03285 [Deltaproteobacteria bacterium]|nr:hypothetical protein [Deltaproteobacteria bacterium]
MRNTFAYILHPVNRSGISGSSNFLQRCPPAIAGRLLSWLPPHQINGPRVINSKYARIQGHIISSNVTQEQLVRMPQNLTLKKVIKAGRLAVRLGAGIIGLGTLTALVDDAGTLIARNLKAAVTTGDCLAIAAALAGINRSAQLMELDLAEAKVLILNATGPVGNICARILSREKVNYLTLISKDQRRLDRLAENILKDCGVSCKVTTRIKEAVYNADVIIVDGTVYNEALSTVELKPGAVVWYTRKQISEVSCMVNPRKDILMFDSGMIRVPEVIGTNCYQNYPERVVEPALAETMLLALEARFERYSLGKHLRIDKIEQISRLADKHGFQPAGLSRSGYYLSDREILQVKEAAKKAIRGKNKSLI